MKPRDIRYARLNSSLARKLLPLFYQDGKTYQFWFGPLRGLRMRYHPAINFHAVLGLWEAETLGILQRLFVDSGVLARDSIVADVGGKDLRNRVSQPNIGKPVHKLNFAVVRGHRLYLPSRIGRPMRIQSA